MSRSDSAPPPLVFVVEDDALLAIDMESSLRAHGYAVLGPAPTIEAADALLDGQHPHAALLDVNLRGTMVTPVARRLQRTGVPYALVTGYARPALDDPALACAPRLTKPVSDAALARVLRHLVGLCPGSNST